MIKALVSKGKASNRLRPVFDIVLKRVEVGQRRRAVGSLEGFCTPFTKLDGSYPANMTEAQEYLTNQS